MLRRLSSRDLTIGELAEPLNMTFAAVSKHVRVLESVRLVRRHIVGRAHFCKIRPKPLAAASEWLRFYERFWNENLDALEAALQGEAIGKPTSNKKERSQ